MGRGGLPLPNSPTPDLGPLGFGALSIAADPLLGKVSIHNFNGTPPPLLWPLITSTSFELMNDNNFHADIKNFDF